MVMLMVLNDWNLPFGEEKRIKEEFLILASRNIGSNGIVNDSGILLSQCLTNLEFSTKS
jgi:hypothetical protein